MSSSFEYQQDLAYVHESAYTMLAKDAADLLLKQIRTRQTFKHPKSDAALVDLGCGGGSLASILSQTDHRIVGWDLSEAMIEQARKLVPGAEFHTGSMLDADLPPCLAVTAIGEVFNYLFDARQNYTQLEMLLQKIYDRLLPGGLLLFDVAGPDRVPTDAQPTVREEKDWTLIVDCHLEAQTLTREITCFRKVGELYRRSFEVHRLQLIEPSRIASSLSTLGFEFTCLESYSQNRLPPGLNAFLAVKPSATITDD